AGGRSPGTAGPICLACGPGWGRIGPTGRTDGSIDGCAPAPAPPGPSSRPGPGAGGRGPAETSAPWSPVVTPQPAADSTRTTIHVANPRLMITPQHSGGPLAGEAISSTRQPVLPI